MKYLRRIIWFFANRLVVLCLILGLIVTVFYYTMNLSNIQIILKDGMANRAKYIMGISADRTELSKYFQNACLDGDSEIIKKETGASAYADYNVRGIDHRLEMGFFWVWPWESTARVTVTESVPFSSTTAPSASASCIPGGASVIPSAAAADESADEKR